MRVFRYFLISTFLLLAGCNSSKLLEKMAPKQDVALAKHYIDDVKTGRFSEIQSNLDPSIHSGDIDAVFTKMSSAIPAGSPIDVKIVGVRIGEFSASKVVDLTFEYSYPENKWVVSNVAFKEQDGKKTIIGIHVYQLPDSLEHLNRFTLYGKSAWHYVFFAMAIIVPLFIVFTLIKCIQEKEMKRKWLWVIFIIFGFVEFVINWTTGQMTLKPIAIGLFGAGAISQPYGPWMVSVYIPVGAMLFWLRRMRRFRNAGRTEVAKQVESELGSQSG